MIFLEKGHQKFSPLDVVIIAKLIDFALQDQLRSLLCLRNDAEANRTILLPEEHKNQVDMFFFSNFKIFVTT